MHGALMTPKSARESAAILHYVANTQLRGTYASVVVTAIANDLRDLGDALEQGKLDPVAGGFKRARAFELEKFLDGDHTFETFTIGKEIPSSRVRHPPVRTQPLLESCGPDCQCDKMHTSQEARVICPNLARARGAAFEENCKSVICRHGGTLRNCTAAECGVERRMLYEGKLIKCTSCAGTAEALTGCCYTCEPSYVTPYGSAVDGKFPNGSS
jgi:hypothetical protein